jgi:hypothetical protein
MYSKKTYQNVSKVEVIDSNNENDECEMILESPWNFSTKKDGFLDKQSKKFNVKIDVEIMTKKLTRIDKTITWSNYTIKGAKKNVAWTFWNLKMESIKQKTKGKNAHEKTNHWKQVDSYFDQEEFSFVKDLENTFDNYFRLCSVPKDAKLIEFEDYKSIKSETVYQCLKFSSEKVPDFGKFAEVFMKEKKSTDTIELKLFLGTLLFYNKRFEDFSEKKLKFKTIQEGGVSNDIFLRTTTSTCKISSAWNVIREWLKSNEFIKEESKEIFMRIAQQKEAFCCTIDSQKEDIFSHFSNIYLTNFVFTDQSLDVGMSIMRKAPLEKKIDFDFKPIREMFGELKNINDDIIVKEGFIVNHFPVNMNWKYNKLIYAIEMRQFERYKKGKFTVEILTKNPRRDFSFEKETDTSLRVFHEDVKGVEEIEELYNFGLMLKNEIEKNKKL